MPAYAATCHRTTESTTNAAGSVSCPASSMRRFKVYDVIVSASATPADYAIVWRIQRHTAAGAGTAVTPTPLDPADAACVTVAADLHSAGPTAGDTLLELALNQRATFRWVAAPGGELVVPATANNGIDALTASYGSFTGATLVQWQFIE